MTPPTTSASGRLRQKPWRTRSMLMSSIMTTKRNSTITAPTYTITSAMARNSAPRSSQIAAAVKKASTRNSTPCTGLRAVMTSTPDTSNTAAKA
jgi:hypothetical protein